jgi:hypothetical protein
MFIKNLSDTRELNMVAAKPYPRKTSQTPLYAVGLTRQGEAAVGAYLRVSGRRAAGPLTSVYQTTDRSSTHSDEEE